MANTDVSTSHSNNNTKKLALKPGETSNLSFWIAQGFMLLATVIGVYLAGQQGLAQALAFDQIQSDKNNYYLRQSLQDELSDNLALVINHLEMMKTAGAHNARRLDLHLDTFIWESMKFSPATLETPSTLLRESSQFYRQVQDVHQKIQSNFYSMARGSQLLQDIVEHMETEVLPAFERDIKALKNNLQQQGVAL